MITAERNDDMNNTKINPVELATFAMELGKKDGKYIRSKIFALAFERCETMWGKASLDGDLKASIRREVDNLLRDAAKIEKTDTVIRQSDYSVITRDGNYEEGRKVQLRNDKPIEPLQELAKAVGVLRETRRKASARKEGPTDGDISKIKRERNAVLGMIADIEGSEPSLDEVEMLKKHRKFALDGEAEATEEQKAEFETFKKKAQAERNEKVKEHTGGYQTPEEKMVLSK